jgi:hypothetical protein
MKKTVQTSHGEVTIEHDLFVHGNQPVIVVKASVGDVSHTHRITIGSEDGNDLLADLSDDDLKKMLQDHIEAGRKKALVCALARRRSMEVAKKILA